MNVIFCYTCLNENKFIIKDLIIISSICLSQVIIRQVVHTNVIELKRY